MEFPCSEKNLCADSSWIFSRISASFQCWHPPNHALKRTIRKKRKIIHITQIGRDALFLVALDEMVKLFGYAHLPKTGWSGCQWAGSDGGEASRLLKPGHRYSSARTSPHHVEIRLHSHRGFRVVNPVGKLSEENIVINGWKKLAYVTFAEHIGIAAQTGLSVQCAVVPLPTQLA